MTKYEFLGDLSRLLSDLPDEERKQAMKYYEDYFADAGESHEQEVLQELGSPEDIAQQIKADSSEHIEYGEGSASHIRDYMQPYGDTQDEQNNGQAQNGQNNWQDGQNNGQAQNGQNGWQNGQNSGQTQNGQNGWQNGQNNGQAQNGQSNWQDGQNQYNQNGQSTSYGDDSFRKKAAGYYESTTSDPGKLAIIIIIAILASPIWGSILIGIFSVIIGIFSAIIGILAALICGGGGVAIGGIGCVFGGIIACIAGEIASGMLTIGIGCVLFSVGAICCYLGIMLCIKLIPALWRECTKGYSWGREKVCQIFH